MSKDKPLLTNKIAAYFEAFKKYTLVRNNSSKRRESIKFVSQQFKNLTEKKLQLPIKLYNL